MRDPTKCKPFLEQILNIKIDHIEYVESEKEISLSNMSHAVRMDIYMKDSNAIYNCEMQAKDTKNLRKRSRYYQGQIDLNNLKPGEDYNKLKRTYVIFVCKFDLFKQDRYVYTFENRCTENLELRLEDESIKIFINTGGHIGNVSEEFKELVHFLDTSEVKKYNNELVNELAEALVEARGNEKWRHDYMTWTQMQNEIRYEGITQGELKNKISLVHKKINKEKTLEVIADELEETIDTIRPIYETVLRHISEENVEEIVLQELIEILD